MGSPQQHCNYSSWDYRCNEAGMQNPVITVPILLTFSTLLVVGIVLWKTCCKQRGQKADPIIVMSEDANYVERDYGVLNAAASFEDMPPYRDPLLEKWELPPDRGIQSMEFVCDGRFGSVCRATIVRAGVSEDKRTAIVRECAENSSPGKVKDFLHIINFHIQVCNHASLVKVLWCQTTAQTLRLFLEDIQPGNLLHFLWKVRQDDLAGVERIYDLTEKIVYSMSLQLASGLEYLIGKLKLIHGYIAACNVLIDQDMNVKLCGLGLAAEVYRTGALSYAKDAEVPIKWLAPERIAKRIITEKSDVWSFGVFLYEVITLGSSPYPDLLPPEVLPKLQRLHRMKKPAQCSNKLFEIMNSCWQWKARNRPSFSELVNQLDSHRKHADNEKVLSTSDTMDFSRYGLIAGLQVAKSQVCSF